MLVKLQNSEKDGVKVESLDQAKAEDLKLNYINLNLGFLVGENQVLG